MTRPVCTRFSLAVVVTFAIATLGFAQNLGQSVTGTFIAEDVQTHQGKLSLDPGSTTILRFYDEISFAFSRRSDILKAVPKGNDLVLYAMTEKAETDLSVLVDGKWHFFLVRIAKGAGLKFYEVKPRGEPVQNPDSSRADTGKTTVLNPSSSVTMNSASSLVSPTWLKFEVRAIQSSGRELRLTYTLENTGEHRVVVSEKQLRILRDGKPLEFTLENNGKLILDPGGLFSGLIRVKASPGPITLQWGLREFGSQNALIVQAELK